MSSRSEQILAQFKSEFLKGASPQSVGTAQQTAKSKAMDIRSTEDYQRIQEMRTFYAPANMNNPYFMPRSGTITDTTEVNGKSYISYSGYNYLGLSDNSRVIQAAQDAIQRYGTHAGAARMVGGEMELHREMEQAFARAFGFDDCVASVGGYVVNVMTIGYLLGSNDVVIMDEHMHNSGLMGAVMAHARRIQFKHNDYDALERLLEENRSKYGRAMILVEGAYSMDGDMADLPRLVELKRKYHTWLMVDEAHSLGVVGATGRGLCEHWGVDPSDVDLVMGTLSKSFASCGGFICASQEIIDVLRHFAPGLLLYSTGLPPASTAAALEALHLMLEEPQRVQTLQHNTQRFVELAQQRDLDIGQSGASAVVPIMLGDSHLALHLMSELLEAGVIAHAVMYPVVPRKEARLRFFLTSQHNEEQFKYTLDVLRNTLNQHQSF